jgi:hypothetical protein
VGRNLVVTQAFLHISLCMSTNGAVRLVKTRLRSRYPWFTSGNEEAAPLGKSDGLVGLVIVS